MRRSVFILGGCVAGGLIALAALPWWLAPVLRVVGHRFHAEFGRYETKGYARFALQDVTVRTGRVLVQVDRVEADTPLIWLFHRATGRPGVITTAAWKVVVNKSETPPAAANPPTGGARHLREILFKVADGLERWAPRAAVGPGLVSWPGGGLGTGAAQWHDRALAVQGLEVGSLAMNAEVAFTSEEIHLRAKPVGRIPWELALTSKGDLISGQVKFAEQAAPLSAQLAAHGWMPATFQVEADHWVIPASELGLGESYAEVRGSGKVEWNEGRMAASAEFVGESRAGLKAPPLTAQARATGTPDAVTMDELSVEAPGIHARLSAPVAFDHRGLRPGRDARFTLAVDLEKQLWLSDAKGKITGTAVVTAAEKGWPRLEAQLEARDLNYREAKFERVTAALALDSSRLRVTEAVVNFAEGGKFSVRGGFNLATREVEEAVAEGTLHSSGFALWLPAGLSFDTLTVTAKAHGPLSKLEHAGHAVAASVRVSKLPPMLLEATWQGSGSDVEISAGRVELAKSVIAFTGRTTGEQAEISSLTFTHDGVSRFALLRPATLRWSPAFELSQLQVAGGDASMTLSGGFGEAGRIAMRIRDLPLSWFGDFLPSAASDWRIGSLDLKGEWDHGPMSFSAQGEAAAVVAPDRTATLTFSATGAKEGIKLESLRVSEATAAIAEVTGRLPVTIYPDQSPVLRLEPEAALALQMKTSPHPAFWRSLAETTGLQFQDPEVNVSLTGTWAEPRGEATVKAARLSVDPARRAFSLPTIEQLDLHATADRTTLQLDRLAVKVEGQEMRLSGQFPVSRSTWQELRQAPLAVLQHSGRWRLEIPDAALSAFARFVPDFLAPIGRVQIDATMAEGGEVAGRIQLHDGGSRRLGPLGVLQAVQADLRLEGRSVHVTTMSALMGGQAVKISGHVALPRDGSPIFDLALAGENLPLVRQTGLLMRADLAFQLRSPAGQPATLTGTVRLRDSMFLSDIRAFLPRGGSGPMARPPFFAINDPPFNAWRLDVDVRGEKFLRLRSPVFVGVASAHFRLSGTLGAPRAIGAATVDSGTVLLPFAAFRVNSGTVRITEADPSSLRLDVNGTSRRYGYDLRMAMTGTAADPIVTFTSSPPLETSEVLLMVTAGEVPRDEITYGTNQRAARFGAYLGQSLINDFGGDATEADRLSISSGDRVSRQGRETYDIEYRMTDRFTLVGEYDEFDDYNAGVKWQMLAPEKPAQKKARPATPAAGKEAPDASP